VSEDVCLTTLFRPVGPQELELIENSGFREFPPRLEGQPYFYPVLNEEYAIQIARDWNAANPAIGAGFVTRFQIRTDFLDRFDVKTVGSAVHQEYWIPAADLAQFNRSIVGKIEVITQFLPRSSE
jgi:hypothetical protein